MPILSKKEFKKKKPKGDYGNYLNWIIKKSPNPKMVKQAKQAKKTLNKPKAKPRQTSPRTNPLDIGAMDVGVGNIRTPDALRDAAAAEINAAIGQEVAPYTDALTKAEQGEKADIADLTSMMGSILPFAQQGAQDVKAGYDEAYARASAVMGDAGEALSEIRANRVAEALSLKDTIGGEVDIGDFTEGIDAEQTAFRTQVAGDLLTTLATAQAGSQEAFAFASQVLPLVQKEEQSQIERMYNEEESSLRREIARIRSSKGERVNARYNEMLAQEREWMLSKTQANRDWHIAQMSLKNEIERLELERASLFGVDKKGNLTLNAQQLNNQQRNETKLQNAKLKERAGALLTQITQGRQETQTQEVPASPGQTGAYQNQNGQWVILKDVKVNVPGVSNPNDMYDYLILNGIPKKMALAQVRLFIGQKTWKPHVIVPSMPGFVGGPSPGGNFNPITGFPNPNNPVAQGVGAVGSAFG